MEGFSGKPVLVSVSGGCLEGLFVRGDGRQASTMEEQEGTLRKEKPNAQWFNMEIFTEWIFLRNEPGPTLMSIHYIKWMTWCLPTFTSVLRSGTLCTSIDFLNAAKPFSSKRKWPHYNL